MSMLSVALHRYLDRHKDEDINGEVAKSLSVGIPFSMRQPAKSIKEIKFNNDFCCLPFQLDIHSDFDAALQQLSQ